MKQQIGFRPIYAVGWTLIVFVLALCAACQHSPGPATHSVRGRVFVGDQPAAGALVVFSRIGDPAGQAERPLGYVNDQGEFQLTTRTLNDGAPVGTYDVAVIWREQEDEDEPPGEYLAPVRYANPRTSGLRVEVLAGENDLEPFVLSKR